MTLKENGGGPPTKLFWWPCPTCRLWHQTRLSAERLEEDAVEVRCPVTGRLVERPVAHKRPAGQPWTPPHRSGLFRRIFRRFRGTR